MPSKNNQTILERITRHAGSILMNHFKRSGIDYLRLKKYQEIVTAADIASNTYITKQLLTHFPEYDIISEEAEKIDNRETKTWYIDPLDGTTNFAYGFTHFAICIGLAEGSDLLEGMVGLPTRKELYYAKKGKGAFVDRKKIHVSGTSSLTQMMTLFCSGYSPEGRSQFMKILHALNRHNPRVRQFASAGVEMTALACGRADAVILTDTKPWDVIAGIVLVREAGGLVTNIQGEEWTPKDTVVIGTNGILHKPLLQVIQKAVR